MLSEYNLAYSFLLIFEFINYPMVLLHYKKSDHNQFLY